MDWPVSCGSMLALLAIWNDNKKNLQTDLEDATSKLDKQVLHKRAWKNIWRRQRRILQMPKELLLMLWEVVPLMRNILNSSRTNSSMNILMQSIPLKLRKKFTLIQNVPPRWQRLHSKNWRTDWTVEEFNLRKTESALKELHLLHKKLRLKKMNKRDLLGNSRKSQARANHEKLQTNSVSNLKTSKQLQKMPLVEILCGPTNFWSQAEKIWETRDWRKKPNAIGNYKTSRSTTNPQFQISRKHLMKSVPKKVNVVMDFETRV